MKIIDLVSDGPENYDFTSSYFAQGSSPKILKSIISFLTKNRNQIESIDGAIYLFNNQFLYDFLKEISSEKINVRIVTIPVEGYDNRYPKDIICAESGKIKYFNQTKYSLASNLFDEYKELDDSIRQNFKILFFPHVYIRSPFVNPFSRGGMPYSLHIKSFFVKMKDGSSFSIITSSNLAVRDSCKNEIMLNIKNEKKASKLNEKFFKKLINISIPLMNYDEGNDPIKFKVKFEPSPQFTEQFFTAPFYKDSNKKVHDKICELINVAKKRIYVCAQHISAYDIFYNKKFDDSAEVDNYINQKGFLYNILDRTDLEVKFLSQTFVDESGNSHGCRRPSNIKGFKNFIEAYNMSGHEGYFVNKDMHSKFIVIDDTLIISTFNYTPTQFIYLKNVNIDEFVKIKNKSYNGIHSEVGQMIIVDDKIVAEKFVKYFNIISNRKNTFKYK